MSDGYFTLRHELHSSLPKGFPLPNLLPRGRSSYTQVGPEGWVGYWPPEDSAVAPSLEWTEAHRILVLAAYQGEWGRFLEDNQEFDIVWPPAAYLTTDGFVTNDQISACAQHGDETCQECDQPDQGPSEIKLARWSWSVTVQTFEWSEGTGSLLSEEGFQFLTTLMDPRDVDYQN